MKVFVVVLFAVVMVGAEPPRYRSSFLQRQEQEEKSAPYPPSGYRPSGAAFQLPERQAEPRTLYGPPEEATTTESSDETTTMEATTLTSASSRLTDSNSKSEAEEVEQVESNVGETQPQAQPQQEGVYYVLLPTGQLQRVQYLTNVDDIKSMAYTTQLKYANVEPIRGPIYAFNPNAQILQFGF